MAVSSSNSLSYIKSSEFKNRRAKSCSALKPSSILLPPGTPEGKTRCHLCDQPFPKTKGRCPHCNTVDTGVLLDFANLADDYMFDFEKEVKRLRARLPNSRNELVNLLFKRAMELRLKQPNHSHQLFQEVLTLDSQHWESRIKLSWLEIKFSNYNPIIPLLEPVVASSNTTVEQKQRAYNNMACSHMFRVPPDMVTAEKFILEGIKLNPSGTVKLYENYGTVLMQTGRLSEAREALRKAVDIDPTSDFALSSLENLKQLEKKNKRKKSKGEYLETKENLDFKVNSINNNNNIPNNNNNFSNVTKANKTRSLSASAAPSSSSSASSTSSSKQEPNIRATDNKGVLKVLRFTRM